MFGPILNSLPIEPHVYLFFVWISQLFASPNARYLVERKGVVSLIKKNKLDEFCY
jgi:hypothetical protein